MTDYLDSTASQSLEFLRRNYQLHGISLKQRVAWELRDSLVFEPFVGTVICNTLIWLLRAVSGLNIKRRSSQLERIVLPKEVNISDLVEKIRSRDWVEANLVPYIRENEWLVTKYSSYLMEELQREIHFRNEVDLKGALEFLDIYQFVTIPLTD